MDSSMDKKDNALERLEDVKIDNAPAVTDLVMPARLAALSSDEYQKLGKRSTLKMDLVIMPILVVMYILNYLDRQNIASARLANIEEDLGLSPVQYQTAVSILFVGYSTSLSSISTHLIRLVLLLVLLFC
jgi:hypothetical protein